MSKVDNSELIINSSIVADSTKLGTANLEAILQALHAVSDNLDAGKQDQETLDGANRLKDLIAEYTANGGSLIPTDFVTPTTLIDGQQAAPIPTVLIPKLFAWIRIYGLNALYTMPTSMIDNSVAIQSYIADGLDKLSETVMNNSQLWSAYGLARLNTIQGQIQTLTDQIVKAGGNPPAGLTTELNTASNAFNLENTYYQKNLELCSTTNTGLNQTSSSTTQTQTLNNQNITQGPLAMMQTLIGIWQVIA